MKVPNYQEFRILLSQYRKTARMTVAWSNVFPVHEKHVARNRNLRTVLSMRILRRVLAVATVFLIAGLLPAPSQAALLIQDGLPVAAPVEKFMAAYKKAEREFIAGSKNRAVKGLYRGMNSYTDSTGAYSGWMVVGTDKTEIVCRPPAASGVRACYKRLNGGAWSTQELSPEVFGNSDYVKGLQQAGADVAKLLSTSGNTLVVSEKQGSITATGTGVSMTGAPYKFKISLTHSPKQFKLMLVTSGQKTAPFVSYTVSRNKPISFPV